MRPATRISTTSARSRTSSHTPATMPNTTAVMPAVVRYGRSMFTGAHRTRGGTHLDDLGAGT